MSRNSSTDLRPTPLPSDSDETEHLENELRLTLEEIAHLRNALAEAKMKYTRLQREVPDNSYPAPDDFEALAQFIHEMEPLMFTLANYLDMLESQTIGSLGSLQLRFLDRMKKTVTQIQQLMEDSLAAGNPMPLQTTASSNLVNLQEVLQEVLSQKASEVEEKSISLQLQFPESLPSILGTADDLFQVIDQILENALQVTPNGEMIQISGKKINEEHADQVILCFSDSGGGIPDELITGLFSIRGKSAIPGCSLNRSQLIKLNASVQEQGGMLEVKNIPQHGTKWIIHFLLVKITQAVE
ncbi:MAG: HAMP domain-containing histidine kinase [Anaerolineaceae bacterium]|nr:HAMP domain-containing histidine kinase [Anaerolineaceae bacterium]